MTLPLKASDCLKDSKHVIKCSFISIYEYVFAFERVLKHVIVVVKQSVLIPISH